MDINKITEVQLQIIINNSLYKKHIIDELNGSISQCIDLKIVNLGNIEDNKGTLFFSKKDYGDKTFEYNLLSAGEKEVVDNNCFLRIGKTASTSLKNYVAHVAKTLNEGVIRYIGNDDKIIEKVGIVGGAGGSELMNAIKANCDCLVTGEVKHNQAIDAIENGIAVIEVSHYVESFFKEYLQQILKEAFPNCEILTSNVEKNPFKHF